MYVTEVAIQKFVARLGVFSMSFVDSQVPLSVFLKAILANELVLFLG